MTAWPYMQHAACSTCTVLHFTVHCSITLHGQWCAMRNARSSCRESWLVTCDRWQLCLTQWHGHLHHKKWISSRVKRWMWRLMQAVAGYTTLETARCLSTFHLILHKSIVWTTSKVSWWSSLFLPWPPQPHVRLPLSLPPRLRRWPWWVRNRRTEKCPRPCRSRLAPRCWTEPYRGMLASSKWSDWVWLPRICINIISCSAFLLRCSPFGFGSADKATLMNMREAELKHGVSNPVLFKIADRWCS